MSKFSMGYIYKKMTNKYFLVQNFNHKVILMSDKTRRCNIMIKLISVLPKTIPIQNYVTFKKVLNKLIYVKQKIDKC